MVEALDLAKNQWENRSLLLKRSTGKWSWINEYWTYNLCNALGVARYILDDNWQNGSLPEKSFWAESLTSTQYSVSKIAIGTVQR